MPYDSRAGLPVRTTHGGDWGRSIIGKVRADYERRAARRAAGL